MGKNGNKDPVYRAHRASLPSSCLPAVGFYPWNFSCSSRVHVFVSYCATPHVQNVLTHLCLADVSKTQLSSHFLKEGSFLFIPAFELRILSSVLIFTRTMLVPHHHILCREKLSHKLGCDRLVLLWMPHVRQESTWYLVYIP